MNACLEPFEVALATRQNRQIRARRRGLEQRAAKLPLFAAQFIADELAARPEYYAAVPTEHDRGLIRWRLAQRDPAPCAAPGLDDVVVCPEREQSKLRASFLTLAYRALAERVLPPMAVYQIACRLAQRRERWAVYRDDLSYVATHWHRALSEAGYERAAWDVFIAHSEDPALARAQYADVFRDRPAPTLAPEQLSLPGFAVE